MSTWIPDLIRAAASAVLALWHTALWCRTHALLAALNLGLALAGWLLARDHLTRAVLEQRVRFTFTPSRRFDPTPEDIWRTTAVVLRAARSGPWWAPARAKTVRVRLRADGTAQSPLVYFVEGHRSAKTLLARTPYDQVTVDRVKPKPDRTREHVLRAEFHLAGDPASPLREVPLNPDPLQPIVDAVAAVRADLGDLAEVILDVQPVPNWRLRLKRWHLAAVARARAQAEARKATRRAFADADAVEESLIVQLARLFEGSNDGPAPGRMAMTVKPQPVEAATTWGRLADDVGLVRIQLLVRCASDVEGRAQASLKLLTAALDIYASRSRLRVDGARLGPFHWGANHPLRRGSFDRRWASGVFAPRGDSWLNIAEVGGLLKPPTVHCRVPVTPGSVPEYALGEPLMPQGWYRGPDGTSRLIASPLEETLFSISVGKSFYGKTTRALVQALAVAAAGQGVFFLDPHGDSWTDAAPYLAHEDLRERVWRIDLTGTDDRARVPSWNPLGVDAGQRPDEVVRAFIDGFAAVLGWDDQSHPRALTILTKAAEALTEINRRAVTAGQAQAQATVFQIRPLLTDPGFREAVLHRLPDSARAWWTSSFTAFGEDAFATVLNPLDRLAANPATKAFLGAPTGRWNARAAMDRRRIVWVCLAGTGPTERLLVNLLLRDLFRAGLSRTDLAPKKRRPFHLWLDELISLDAAGASGTIAQIAEQLRKFGVRMHVMVQLLERIDTGARLSLLQNASVLSTTAGSLGSVRAVTDQWHGALSEGEVADLPRYHHALSVTVGGRQIGPLTIRGPRPAEVFRALHSPKQVGELIKATNQAVGARTAAYLTRVADKQAGKVLAFLTASTAAPRQGREPKKQRPTAVQLLKSTHSNTEYS